MNAAAIVSLLRQLPLPPFPPFPLLALALCLAFDALGLAVLDDYGVGIDEPRQRRFAEANLEYILGDYNALPTDYYNLYGVAFDLPLLLIERTLGLEDSRHIHLLRHLLTHLFFVAGGFFCGLLAYRMFGSRALALLGMLLFLLHPRLYAHSFFNSKDPILAAMFMIALFLIHRTFRRGTPGAFALCGFGVGLAIDLRIFGLLLLLAVLAMRALDFWQAAGASERRRVLATGGAFAAAALVTMSVVHPYYWANPLRFLDAVPTLAQHPTLIYNLFQGEVIRSDEVPPHFIPTWFAITAPPVTLLLGGIGAAAVCWQAVRRPHGILRNGELRFRLLLVGCATLPVAIIVALQSNTFNGWRHFYFLWAPFSLLAAVGLLSLAKRGGGARRWLAWGAAGAGLACVAVAMAWLHPHQQIYFNLLADRRASGGLAQRHDMDYWFASGRQALEHLRARHPDAVLHVYAKLAGIPENRWILPAQDRQHIVLSPAQQADYHIGSPLAMRERLMPSSPVVHEFRAYGNAYPYLMVVAPRLVWGTLRPDAGTYRTAHRALVEQGEPAARGLFDIHLGDDALYYVKEDCDQTDTEARFFLHTFPVEAEDLPLHRRKYWFDNRDFDFGWRGGYFDGKCMTKEPLPDYPIARIRTGQFIRGAGQLWKAEFAVGEQPAAAFDRPKARG